MHSHDRSVLSKERRIANVMKLNTATNLDNYTYSAEGLWELINAVFSCFTHCCTVLGSTRARDIMWQVCGASHTAAQYWGPLELGT